MAKRKRAKKAGPYEKAKKKPLGSGERFQAVAAEAAAGGAQNPAAVAYKAGVQKHGKAKMAQLAAAGRRRAYAAQRRRESRADG
jgi:hypothetical protein